jgi:hypothetical protein
MRYSLRSLMIAVLVLPPLLAGTWSLGSKLFEKPPRRESFSLVQFCSPYIIIQHEDEARLGLNGEAP